MGSFFILFLFNRCSNYRAIKQSNRNHTITPTALRVPKLPCHLSRVNHQHHLCTPPPRTVPLLQQMPNTYIRTGFFELPVILKAQVLLSHRVPITTRIFYCSSCPNMRISHISISTPLMHSSSTRAFHLLRTNSILPAYPGQSDESRASCQPQRESVMENSPSPSCPSSPLPSMQGIFYVENEGIVFGRQPSLARAHTQPAEKAQMPMTPSKLGKRKSLGFVRLEFCGRTTEEKPANAGKYPTLGLGLGRRASGSDHGDQQQQQ